MSWNYRVVRRTVDGVEAFGIHEAHYDEGAKEPHSITVNPREFVPVE